MGRKVFTGWKLEAAGRERLLQAIPAKYPRLVADHVTLSADAGEGARAPAATTGEVIGVSDDGAGVQALVVAIAGSEARPDGSTFHITWSLGEGRRPVESNTVIAEHGFKALDAPMSIALRPVRLER